MMKNVLLVLLSISSIGLAMMPRQQSAQEGIMLTPSAEEIQISTIIVTDNPATLVHDFIAKNFHRLMILALENKSWKVAKFLLDYAAQNPKLLTESIMRDPYYLARVRRAIAGKFRPMASPPSKEPQQFDPVASYYLEYESDDPAFRELARIIKTLIQKQP